jgi:UDP-2,3-diacylglucosamine pyrophosphatase LpxH
LTKTRSASIAVSICISILSWPVERSPIKKTSTSNTASKIMISNPRTKYVCISDLHLGAEYSVLTHIDSKEKNFFSKVPDGPSQTLKELSVSLRLLMKKMSLGQELPVLVLMGDILDLSFSSLPDASRTFVTFIKELFSADSDKIFSNQIILLPGNHDHQLWKSIKDRWFEDNIGEQIPADVMEVTKLFDKPSFGSDLLNNLIHNIDGLKDLEVVTAYPNLGESTDKRCIVLHHGHFIESTYRVMSLIADWYLEQEPDNSSYALEQENGPWIEFLWSSLGNDGSLEKTAIDLFTTLNDPAEAHKIVDRLAKTTIAALGSAMPIGSGPISPQLPGITYEGLLAGVYDFTLGNAAESERQSYHSVLSKSGLDGLKNYLTTTILAQVRDKNAETKEMTFVFGHTHKPFQDRVTMEGYTEPVNVFNTGGWVLDNAAMTATQGAALVFVDEELQVASLRLFNDHLRGQENLVHAAGVGGYPDRDNKMLIRLRDAVNPEDWKGFSEAFDKGILTRAEIARKRFFNPETNPETNPELNGDV